MFRSNPQTNKKVIKTRKVMKNRLDEMDRIKKCIDSLTDSHIALIAFKWFNPGVFFETFCGRISLDDSYTRTLLEPKLFAFWQDPKKLKEFEYLGLSGLYL